jgi:2-polyprenyl-3-methyl-5-hydroxy-6-metoxy-1,4-benzoquinol methylase
MSCRLCGVPTRPLAARADLTLHRCPRCGFVSGAPVRTRTASERYEDYYQRELPPAPVARYHEWLARAERRLGQGRLLEVGAGAGGLVRVARERGWTVHATEVSESGLEQLRATGAEVFAGDVVDARYPDGHFDLVVSLEVIEHLPAPAPHLRELCRVTRPGGLLLLSTPNFNGVSRRRFGTGWRVIDPEHLGYFSPRTLGAALREAGFRSVRVGARSIDLTSWRRRDRSRPAQFDGQASARLRDQVESSRALSLAKAAINACLALTRSGDSLLAWAER